jgi:epoxyqueuosine reductase
VAARSERVKHHARQAGFDLVGITGTSVPEAYARYLQAMAAGYGAQMRWLYDKPGLREDVRNVWPEARSVIVLAVSYASEGPGYLERPPSPDEGWISRYAQGRDYHLVVKKMLLDLAQRLAGDPALGAIPSERHRLFVDTGPVLEKAFAQAAGLGWIGKNALLIHPGRRTDPLLPTSGRGSWYFLATLLTPLELAPDAPETDHCGSCTRCLDVCPTAAFPAPYVLDARRCIANWTIESAEPAEVIAPRQIGQHLFGCDLCQEVCPWNGKATPTRHAALRPRPENVRVKLDAILALDDAGFRARFPKSAVRRVSVHQVRQVVAAIRAGQGGEGAA